MGQALLYLVGFMGAGKTSVGELIAELTGKEVIDTDEYIVQKEQLTINDIFGQFGEDYFRQRETEVLNEISAVPAIITTGGGIILNEKNRTFLKKSGRTIFLKCHPETVISRLGKDETRPLIRDKSLKDIIDMYEARLPLYEECAHFTIDTESQTIEAVAKNIIERMKLT